MSQKAAVQFFRRRFPSANMAVLPGEHPVLVDAGFGSDLEETVQILREAGTQPEHLSLLINTHYHGDHAGGNFGLQTHYGLPIAASRLDAAMINRRDPDACGAEWLGQPVEPYYVERVLEDGDEIDTGGLVAQVVATPGHTLGHISLYLPEMGELIAGDAVHSDDAAWINVFREGVGALDRALVTLDRLEALKPRWMCSGHGPATDDPLAAIGSARRRYERWLTQPESLGWHACKRIFSYALMIFGGMDNDMARAYLLGSPWFYDYSRYVFHSAPQDFVQPLVDEMLRSGAAEWHKGLLAATAPYTAPPKGWLTGPPRPSEWPEAPA